MAFAYPVSLELEGRACAVFGGGEVAELKARGLLEAGAKVVLVAPTFTPGIEAVAQRGEIELRRRPYRAGDLEGTFLAIAATDDPDVNRRIFREAESKGVLLNSVDDVANCHFAVPSVVRRGDFMLAISTGGKAPALAKRLRRRLAIRFGAEYGTLVDLLGAARAEALPRRKVDFDTWASRWQAALDQDLLELIRAGELERAKASVTRILDGDDIPPMPSRKRVRPARAAASRSGRVAIVGAGPGDPKLITVRGQELLAQADVVVYDRLVHPSLVAGKSAVFVGKRRGGRHASQQQINSLLVGLARRGNLVVRLKGGDPFVFGRGSEEAEALSEAGIEFEVVPAPTSAIAALAYAGIPVTDRRCASSVAFVTGQSAGDRTDWERLATATDTVVVLMGLEGIDDIAARLIRAGRDPLTPAAVIENGTLEGQRVVTAELQAIASRANEIESPAIIVVGEVVKLRERISWFEPSTSTTQVESENRLAV
ncbi:MAG: siroheme synthase CysG [Actinomycetota bacterium]